MDSGESAGDPTDSKVGRLIETYGLSGLGEELAARWTAPADERSSLRELADVFNRRLLSAALEDAGVETIDGDVESVYRVLTDDVSAGVRTETKRRLRREGVDVDELESAFVSHQAIHTYLRTYRDVAYEPDERSPERQREIERDRIRRLRRRTEVVTEDAISRLAGSDRLSVGDSSVLVDVRVFCDDCGTDYTVDELLDLGGCACTET
ncbi:rod-determining factor RdfA [Halovivax gelatinilyticus]|uniref:rod-determining factor RdfA n=1 Tax=Halovivax gelatinilyticus TaxID=2961597 RepID=UPI0020CA7746|nr:rod-determining factor RdfA [Halovivax gelatinilyticus]